jgi:hypothetical protein
MCARRRRCWAAAPITAGGAALEAVRGPGAVRRGVGVVVLELHGDAGHVQAQAADAGQHPTVGRGSDGDVGMVARGLAVGDLAGEQFGLLGQVVDDLGAPRIWTVA